MRDSVVWVLIIGMIISAMFVVYVRHQHRIAYTLLHAEQQRRDTLNDEWTQLLTEVNLWSFHHSIEKDATKHLHMRVPNSKEVEYVKSNSRLERDSDG